MSNTRSVYAEMLKLLAKREYSAAELRMKFARSHEATEIESALMRLQEQDYQSDERYVAVFIRSKINSRQGPKKIAYELSQKSVANDLIEAAFAEQNVDWYQQAYELLERKFGSKGLPTEPEQQFKERAKRMRFLMQRGFDGDLVRSVCDDFCQVAP